MALMTHRRALASFFLVLWLNTPGSKAATKTNFVYEKNGVRLVGGDATKGTLELLPRASLSGAERFWVPVCPDGFDDDTAQIVCANLGYKFGRQYYSPELAFPTNTTAVPAQIISCGTVDYITSTYGQYGYGHHRRHLRAAFDTHGRSGGSASGIGTHGSDTAESGLLPVKRRGLSPNWLLLDANSTSAPYSCAYRNGLCNPKGPMVAVQCSNYAFQPAPPPPPSPPNPPPSPPAVSNYIRIIGAIYENNFIRADGSARIDGSLETNLCATKSAKGVCQGYARVEMQVDSPNTKAPGKIWAPVCNITNSRLAKTVAYVACSQRFQEKRKPWQPNVWYISADVSATPLLIPKGKAFSASDFNPTKVGGWVTISSANYDDVRLQDAKYKVSVSPCTRGAMLAITCNRVVNPGALRRQQ